MKLIKILILLLTAILIENCGNGVRKTSDGRGKTPLLDTTFFVGEHKLFVGDLECDTSFLDTIFYVRPTNDSIIFFVNYVLCNHFNSEFIIRKDDYHFEFVSGKEFKISKSIDSDKLVVFFNLDSISKNGRPYFDSLYYSYYLSINANRQVHYDKFLGHVINK